MTDQRTAEQKTAEQQEATQRGRRVGPAWILSAAGIVVILVAWFFFAWLALDRHIVDAAGESVGSGFALLLIVSVIGAVRNGRT